jgi:hypothetical protein
VFLLHIHTHDDRTLDEFANVRRLTTEFTCPPFRGRDGLERRR